MMQSVKVDKGEVMCSMGYAKLEMESIYCSNESSS